MFSKKIAIDTALSATDSAVFASEGKMNYMFKNSRKRILGIYVKLSKKESNVANGPMKIPTKLVHSRCILRHSII